MLPTNTDEFKQAIEEALTSRGNVNILIAGKTGVGKSTLINTVFEGQLAETGHGRPVTQETREISKEGIPVRILDTRGLEVKAHHEVLRDLENLVRARARESDPNKHLHLAWLCLSEDSRRVEDAEVDLLKMLHAAQIPVLVVITKARSDNGFREEVEKILPEAANVVRVRALQETLDEGTVLPPMGLKVLVDTSMEIVPEGQKNAVAAAQQVDLALRVSRAHKIVASAAVGAGAAALTPIPFADIAILLPIEISMLASISAVFGLKLDQAFMCTLVGSALTGMAGNVARRALVAGLVKLIPGVGSAAGGALQAVAATTFTTMFGEAYIATLSLILSKKSLSAISPAEIAAAFKEQLSSAKAKLTSTPAAA